MRPPVPWFLAPLVLVTLLGCPLDIQVRPAEHTDAGCQGRDCQTPCVADSQCLDSERCDTFDERCE